MTWGAKNITVVIAWLCAIVLGLGAIAFPTGYFLLSYQYMAGSLEAEAEFSSRAITQLIGSNPTMWEFEQVRLNEALARPGHGRETEQDTRRVINKKGQTVAERREETPTPAMTRSRLLYDAGVPVGRLEVVRSIRPLLQRTGGLAVFSLAVSLLTYLVLFKLPIRSLRRIEQALRDSEETHRRFLEAANDAIVIVDGKRGVIVHANTKAALLTGIPVGELVGQAEAILYPADEPMYSMASMRTDLEGGVSMNHEVHVLDRSGHKTPVEVSASLIDVQGRTVVLGIFRDISERQRAEAEKKIFEEKLQRMEKMESLGLLAGGVAHDLNNMLGPLVAYPELILMKLPEDSPVHKHVTKIGVAAQQAADVVQDLLTLARRGRYEMNPLILNEVISTYLESPAYDKLCERHPHVRVETDLVDPLYPILGSAIHLTKVVANLVANAFDAMPRGGELTIRTRNLNLEKLADGFRIARPGPHVSLSIRDTGIGIDTKDKAKIFEPYYSTKKMGASGSGLGLSVVYGVVKDHGGYSDVISAAGEGAEFVLYFPVTLADRRDDFSPTNDIKGRGTVLVVDDSPEQRDLACDLLSTLGYTVTAVSTGHEAVDYLSKTSADIVVIDMILEPGFDGLDTYSSILALRPDQKTIIITGYSSTDRVNEMQRLGAGALVMKPYTAETIGLALRHELDRPRHQGNSTVVAHA